MTLHEEKCEEKKKPNYPVSLCLRGQCPTLGLFPPHLFCAHRRTLLGSVEFFLGRRSPQESFPTWAEVLRELEATVSRLRSRFPAVSLEGCLCFIRSDGIKPVNQTSTLGCLSIHTSNAFPGPVCWKGDTTSKVLTLKQTSCGDVFQKDPPCVPESQCASCVMKRQARTSHGPCGSPPGKGGAGVSFWEEVAWPPAGSVVLGGAAHARS